MATRYFKDRNGHYHTSTCEGDYWVFRSESGESFLAPDAKSAGMAEVTFNEFAGINN